MEKYESNNNEAELLLHRVKVNLTDLKKQATEAKAKKESYNIDAINFDPELITQEEADLWEEVHNLKTMKDCEDFRTKLYKYKDKVYAEIEEEARGKGEKLKPLDAENYPRIAFFSYLGSQFSGIMMQIGIEERK